MAMTRKRFGRPKAHGNATAAARWLQDRFDRLMPRLSVRRPDWGEVLADMARAGIAHGGGDPPAPLTEETLRKMWRRVERDVAAEAQAAAANAATFARPRAGVAEPAWVPEPARRGGEAAAAGGGSDYLAALKADIGRRSGRR